MRIEMIVNTALLPKNGLTLLQQEMERRVWQRYPDARIRMRKGTNNHLDIYAPKKGSLTKRTVCHQTPL